MVRLMMLLWVCWCGSLRAEQVRLAAASDLVFCLAELNQAFHTNHPSAEITVASGSSG